MHATLPLRHFLLALAVVAVWGTNFVIIKLALGVFPPFLFAALRFALAFFPAVLFLPRPSSGWGNVATYGGLIGLGQFGLLYLAINGHIAPGLASLVVQTQVFFTIGLSMLITRERLRGVQWLALAMAALGIGVIGWNTGGDSTVLGLALVLAAALCWALGNQAAKQGAPSNMLAYVVWSSAFAVPPLLLVSWWVEGAQALRDSVQHANAAAWAAVAWQAWGNTLFGYVAWGWLLARHPAATVTPMALLVPVFGMAASSLWLAEGLPPWKLVAAALVIGGLALNLLAPHWTWRPRGRAPRH